jgi:hypothetical protein
VSGISDAASGRVGAERVSSHEFLLVGFALVIVLWRRVPDAGLPPTQRQDSRWRWHDTGEPDKAIGPDSPVVPVLRLLPGGRIPEQTRDRAA